MRRRSPATPGPPAPAPPRTPANASASPRPLRILLIDDHAIVRDGLRQILVTHFHDAHVAEARNAKEAVERLLLQPADVALLDISMPGQSGIEVLKQIKELVPRLKVLVLTMHPEDQYAVRVLRAGADGYLTKDTASAVLVEAVKRVLAGGKYISSTLAQDLATNLHTPREKAPHELLSDREYQVLRMLGAGKSVKEIGFDLALSIKTVSTYRTRVLTKLKLKSNAEVMRYALREKLVD